MSSEQVVDGAPGAVDENDKQGAAQDVSAEANTNNNNVQLNGHSPDDIDDRPTKRARVENHHPKGVAPIKPEYLIDPKPAPTSVSARDSSDQSNEVANNGEGGRNKKKQKGQNTNRRFGSSRDAIQLCISKTRANEFAPDSCQFGADCKFEHDLRRYLREGKRENLDTFGGRCPVYDAHGECGAGWRCRFVGAHSEERTLDDGRVELVLLDNVSSSNSDRPKRSNNDEHGVVNVVSAEDKINLKKRHTKTPKSDLYTQWLNEVIKDTESREQENREHKNSAGTEQDQPESEKRQENRAQYREPPFLPSEKRRIYYGPETPILAPLTTQGNLPFRRLCVELGAQVTWSEMAMGLPLVQGEKPEWALLKAHESEITPPKYYPKTPVVDGYDNARDLKFGAQIAGNKPWIALKTTEVVTALCPHLRAVDLNCGCPIDLVYRQGAGSALLDTPGKLEKILRGMNAVSGEVPVTVKIRTGTRDNKPTASRLVSRLAFGGPEADDMGLGPAGVAAIALHGRSRQQRYTRSADWEYIAECAAVIQSYRSQRDSLVDTINAPDPRDLSPSNKQTSDASTGGNIYFIGNGDVYSHTDYFEHLNPSLLSDKDSDKSAAVDAVMIARGALIKPWIFEEIERGQHLDKTSSERLEYIERFARYGLQVWGADEIGVGTTRRFLLEWLSFACRYVPVGMLERLPPRIQDRPPAFRGRDELETLLSSDNYKDWIKISEMFLGPAHKDFKFTPKHKSNMDPEG